MHDRNRATPVALPRQAPVAQAELGDTVTDAVAFAEGDGGFDGLFAGLPCLACEPFVVEYLFRLERHIGFGQFGRAVFGGQEGRDDRQAVFRGEVEVALIMRGAAKDRARAVIHQDEVGDIDRQFPGGVEGMTHAQASVEALLFSFFKRFLGRATLAAIGAEGRDLGVVTLKLAGQRMIGRDAHEAGAQQGIGASGIDLDPVGAMRSVDQREGELQAARLADPVRLHQPHLGGPVVQPVQRGQQFFGIVGNLEEPLRQLAPFDIGARSPALAVDHLLIGKNGHVDRVPVHHGVLAIDQALFQHIEEKRLLLAVVFGIAGGELAAPVDGQAQRFHLRAHVRDVLIGPVLGVAANRHRGVFGRHAESVPAHRVQHVEALGHLVARDHVAHRVVAHMPHVDASRRIGEHFQHVIFRLGRLAARHGAEQAGAVPGCLPFRFDLGGIIA